MGDNILRVVHVTEKINELAGGPSEHTAHLAAATAMRNAGSVEVVACDLTHLGKIIDPGHGVKVKLFKMSRPYLFGYSKDFNNHIEEISKDPEAVFHVHNMWRLQMVSACKSANRNGTPDMISPHGAITPWAMSAKAFRKRVMWALVEKQRLEKATVIRTTSIPEADYIHSLAPKAKIVVIPAGVNTQPVIERNPEERPTALFLSRITFNKGPLSLIRAWAKVKPRDWKLVIAGSNLHGHQIECEKEVERLGLGREIEFIGPAFQEKKWKVFQKADLFILPTLSENFGMAIAEALACGLPVITTKGAPWPDIEDRKCGWWIDHGDGPLEKALAEATAMDRKELKEIGSRGRQLVEDKYSWPAVAKSMIDVYKWMKGQGDIPESARY